MRILLVDDNVRVRRSIRSLLADRPDWSVCGEAADGIEAVEKARQCSPEVVLMDISMPRMDGVEATRIIRQSVPGAKVIIVSQNDPAVVQRQAAQCGASAWIAKSELPLDLLPCIDRVSQENPALPSNSSSQAALDTRAAVKGDGAATAFPEKNEAALKSELEVAKLLQAVSAQTLIEGDAQLLYDKIMDAAVGIMRSDFSSMQTLFPDRGVAGELHLEAFRGFDPAAAKFWEWVRADSNCSCGEALRSGKQTIVPDVETCAFMAGTADREAYLRAGIRAVQSTLLVSRDGRLLGMISTHWRAPHQPSEHDLRLFDILARQAADLMERKQAEAARTRTELELRALTENLEMQVRERTGDLERKHSEVMAQSEQLRELSAHLLRSQDEERRRIARELHDSAGQILTVMAIEQTRLAAQLSRHMPALAQQMEEIRNLTDQLTREIRTTSYLLHPPMLDEGGLPNAVQWYIDGLAARTGIDIEFQVSEDFGRLEPDAELALFRAVQEALTNIHRHSGSASATIRMTRNAAGVSVEVQDYGKGMSPDRLREIQSRGGGVGVRGMRERIHQLGGALRIDSTSRGTTVSVNLPARQIPSEAPPPERPLEQLRAAASG